MITTTYICDHCKEEKDPARLYIIRLAARAMSSSSTFEVTPVCGEAHWCNDCIHTLRFFKPIKLASDSDTPPPSATLEQLIQQLVIDTIQNNLPQ